MTLGENRKPFSPTTAFAVLSYGSRELNQSNELIGVR